MMERLASDVSQIPPQNLDAEQSVLGSMMLEKPAALKGMEILRAEDFYRPVHQEVFDALATLVTRDEPADLITLQEELRKRDKLNDIGGTEYLMSLVDSVPTAANVEHYAKIVLKMSRRRQVISVCTELIGTVQNDEECEPVELLIGKALSLNTGTSVQLRSQRDVVMSTYEMIKGWSDGVCTPGVPTGLPTLDRLLNGGVNSKEVLTFVGESGGGKSVILGSVIEQAGKHRTPTLVFSYDMDAEDYSLRILCSRASVDSADLQHGRVNWEVVTDFSGDMYDYPIDWQDLPCSLEQLTATATRWALANAKDGNGLIVVDYIQRVNVAKRTQSRTEEVGEIIRGLKNLARRTGCAVATASQFTKQKPDRTSRSNADIRDSKAIEDESDKVVLIRPDHLNVTKHRRGPTGKVAIYFNRQYTRFEEIDENAEEPTIGSNGRGYFESELDF